MTPEHHQSGAAATSLVRSSKKPTPPDLAGIEAELADLAREAQAARTWSPPVDDLAPVDATPAGRWVRLACENWRAITRDDESGALYTPIDPDEAPRRAVLITQGKKKPTPPRQHGDRWTTRLTRQAAAKIEGAALYSHRTGRGFRTFATLTLTPEARAQLKAWDFADREDATRRSLGAMVSDFLKVLKMAWTRGQVLRVPVVGEYGPMQPKQVGRLRGKAGPLLFCWVAECPLNEAGDPNPHVHLMMNWSVQKKHFRAWAGWMESHWPGFVKLERLRKPKGAAAYMAKAARYIAKGQDGGQGAIRGNRYGIATEARAPCARHLGTYYADFLKDAVEAMQAARDKLKASGLWAGAYAFGATTRAAWGRLWGAMRRDGFRFDPAPPDLCKVSLENTLRAHQRAERARLSEWIATAREYCHENWRSLFDHYHHHEDRKQCYQ